MDPAKAIVTDVVMYENRTQCKLLEVKTCQTKEYIMMPLCSGVSLDKKNPGKVYVLFDSASPVYDGSLGSNVATFRTDYIWSVTVK